MSLEYTEYFTTSLLATLTTVALLSNILVCVIVYQNVWIMHSTNLFVLGLASLDILAASIPLPMTIGVFVTSRWPFSEDACIVLGLFNDFVSLASMFTIVFIAINRYYAIVKPHEYREVFTGQTSITILIGLWIGAALYSTFPVLTSWAKYHFSLQSLGCVLVFDDKAQKSIWIFATLIVCIAIPTYLISHSYLLIYRTVRRRQRRIGIEQPSLHLNIGRNTVTKTIRLTKTFAIVSLIFALCWLPTSITLLIGDLVSDDVFQVGAYVLKNLLALSSASKIFVYMRTNRCFRKELFKLFGRLIAR